MRGLPGALYRTALLNDEPMHSPLSRSGSRKQRSFTAQMWRLISLKSIHVLPMRASVEGLVAPKEHVRHAISFAMACGGGGFLWGVGVFYPKQCYRLLRSITACSTGSGEDRSRATRAGHEAMRRFPARRRAIIL
jgi:hypothetical protein